MRIAQHLILGGTQTKAPASIAAHNASNAMEFLRATGKKQLLPLNAADRVWSKSVRVRKGGEHQSQILSSKRSITCPLKRGRSIPLANIIELELESVSFNLTTMLTIRPNYFR